MKTIVKKESNYVRVKCAGETCDNEFTVFIYAKKQIACDRENCGAVIATPGGGKAKIIGEIIGFVK